jgi:hypothetical protein
MYTKPSSSSRAKSPVLTQPSTKVSAVACGWFQYPRTTIGPRYQSSPTSPTGMSRPSPPTFRTAPVGDGTPQRDGFSSESSPTLLVAVAEVSVRPHPCPVCSFGKRTYRRRPNSGADGAPP